MSDKPRERSRVDRDGVRTIETSGVRGRVWLLAVGIALVGITLFILVRPALRSEPDEKPVGTEMAGHKQAVSRSNVGQPQPGPQREAQRAVPRNVQPRSEAAPRSDAPVAAQPTPPKVADAPGDESAASDTAAEESGEDKPTGIALFPPPGTKPIKRGIIVPDDFEVPPGYVRHYQTTDQGQQLPAILMFHPDYKLQDEKGNPVPMPEDRVVPPEMAPPGLPVQILEVPDAQEQPPPGPRSSSAARGSEP